MRNCLRPFALAFALLLGACDDDDPAPVPTSSTPVIPPATLLGITDQSSIVQFRAATPGTLIGTINITGVQDQGSANPPFPVAMDIRPSNNQIYVLYSDDRLYTVAPSNGAATLVGLVPIGNADVRAMDFNPSADVIRMIGQGGENFRINPTDGSLIAQDSAVAYAANDPNAGDTPAVDGVSYTGATGGTNTTAYVLDGTQDVLATLGNVNGAPENPNGGRLFTVGALNPAVGGSGSAGFDIETISNNPAGYIADGAPSNLYRVNLATAALTNLGAIGSNLNVIGLSVVPGTGGTGTTTPPPTNNPPPPGPPPPAAGGSVGLAPGDGFCTNALAGTGFTVEVVEAGPPCLVCAIDAPENLVDTDLENVAHTTMTGVLAASISVTVTAPEGTTFTPDADGVVVGAVFALPGGDPGELALLPLVTVETLNDGAPLDPPQSGDLGPTLLADLQGTGIVPVGSEKFFAGFIATAPFDAIRLTYDAGIVGVNTTIDTFYVCSDAPEAGAFPDLPGP